MTVNLSMLAGAGAQFFDGNGNPLTGGKLYSYAAGTTTPQTTYTTNTGSTAHANPIILDSAGRVPSSGEIWLTDSVSYKFVLKDSSDITIATYDNISGNGSGIYDNVFARLAQSDGSSLIGYIQSGAGAVATTVEARLRQIISVKDFGAVGDGNTDDTVAIQLAFNSMTDNSSVVFPPGTYLVAPTSASDYVLKLPDANNLSISGPGATIKIEASSGNYRGIIGYVSSATPDGLLVQDIVFDHNGQNNNLGSLAAYTAQGRYTLSNYDSGGSFDRIAVSNITVKNCDSVVSIYFSGGSSTAGSVSVDNCEWINARNYNGQDYDQSFINCRCDYLSITNNRFRGESWAYSPRTAIETHASNQIVTDNVVEKFQIGINVTGISQTGTTYDHLVANNIFEVSRDGILIWSQPLAPASATTGFENMLISKNIVRMRPDQFNWTASAGLRGIAIFGGSDHIQYKNLIIDGNQIVYPLDQAGSSYTTKSSSQSWGAISSNTNTTINADAINVEITNNQVINCPMSGLFIDFSDWSGLKIEGNTFIDCGSTQNASPAFNTKCVVYFAGYLIGDCSISRNVFVDNFATTQVTDYIFVRDRTASPVYFFDVRDNEFRFADAATIVAGADYLGVYSSSILARFFGEVPLATNPRLPAITGGINSKTSVRNADVVYVKNASGTTAWQAQFYSSSSPSTGTWRVGDIAWNTAPVAGGTPGWICTTAGTSGTWKAMANLAV